MKNHIAIIESDYMNSYLHTFCLLCIKNNIKIDILSWNKESKYKTYCNKFYLLHTQYKPKKLKTKKELEKEIKSLINIDNYDYILTDSIPLSFSSNVFHYLSIIQRLKLIPNIIYRIIFFLGHIKEILNARYSYRKCPKIITVSKTLKQDYSSNCKIDPKKIIVAYPGNNSISKNEIEFKIKNNVHFIIGSSTCGFTTKGGYNILEALRIFRKKYPNRKIKVRLINPNYKKQVLLKLYLKLTKLNEYIEFLEYQDNMNAFYQSLDCLICASRHEAFGRVVSEAMTIGIPVLVTSNVGASEIIEDNVSGFIAQANNNLYENIADKIEEIILKKQNLEPIIKNAKEIASNLTWENFANTIYQHLYVLNN